MEGISQGVLWRYASGSLEAPDAAEVAARIATDPRWAAALAEVEARIEAAAEPDRWSTPRLGLPGRAPPLRAEFASQVVLSGEPPRAGDRVEFRVADPQGPSPRPVLVREAGGRSEVIHPRGPDDWPRLDEFPPFHGLRRVDLVLEAPAGDQRFVLVLAPPDSAVDWSAPPATRWAALREAVEEGRVPAVVGALRVEG